VQRALFKHEEQAVASIDDTAALGDECLRNQFTRVMDEDSMQRPAGRPVTHMQREPALDRGEAPGDRDVGYDVGIHSGQLVAQAAHAEWAVMHGDRRGGDRYQRGEQEQRPEYPPWPDPGGAHHHKLGIAIQPVERVDDRDEQGGRRGHQQEGRQR
jgi:hypothetical protein